VRAIITKVAGGTQAIQEVIKATKLDKKPKIQGPTWRSSLSPADRWEVLAAAERYAKGMQDDYVSTEHLLLGLADSRKASACSSSPDQGRHSWLP